MSRKEPTVEVLLSRFEREVNTALLPFVVLSVIERNGSASRQEIRDEIGEVTGGRMDPGEASDDRLMGRMEKTFGLIEPVEPAGKTSRADTRFGLTQKGRRLHAEAWRDVLAPLLRILPEE